MYPTVLLLAWFPFLQEQAQVEKTLEHHTLVHVSSPPHPTSRSLVEPWRTVVRRGDLMGTSCEVVAHTAAMAADKAAWLAAVAAAFMPLTRAFTLSTVVVVVAIRAAAAAATAAVEDVTTAATSEVVEGEALVVSGHRGCCFGQADGGHLGSGDQQIEDALRGQPIVPNVHGNGTQTPTLPADVAALLQQALASIHQGAHPPPVKDNVNAMAKTTKPKEGNDASELVPIRKMSKATLSNEAPESSAQAATRDSSGKTPYCYRCLTKGHVREDCDAGMYCEICNCIVHLTSRCPKFRGDKPCAIPCGYAVEGLGFYHIPQSVTSQQRSDARPAVIRVTDGTLTSNHS